MFIVLLIASPMFMGFDQFLNLWKLPIMAGDQFIICQKDELLEDVVNLLPNVGLQIL